MIRLTFTALILGYILVASGCNPFNGRRGSIMSFSSSGNEQKIVVNDDNLSLEIIYSGNMEFNDEETAIKKLSPGGYLEYRRNGARLLAETDSRGEVYYEYYSNGMHLDPDNNGRKFLAQAIQDMIGFGINAKGRMERLYQLGGISLLLQETDKLKTDHVRKNYYEFILHCDSISREEMIAITQKISTTINADNEKKQLLEKVPAAYLDDSITCQAYFTAVKSINSDNDKANLLKDLVKKRTPANDNVAGMLDVIATINSEHDKNRVLHVLLEEVTMKGEDYSKLLDEINNINSGNDKSNILKSLIKNQPFENEHFAKLLRVIGGIHADNEKSDVFKKLAEQPVVYEENWISLINEVPTISSDNDKANVLLQIARKMPRSEKVKTVYLGVCKTISSQHDYTRTVKDVEN